MPVSVDFVVFISFVIFFLACETTRRRVACTIYFLFYPFENELIFLCRTAILIKVKEKPISVVISTALKLFYFSLS